MLYSRLPRKEEEAYALLTILQQCTDAKERRVAATANQPDSPNQPVGPFTYLYLCPPISLPYLCSFRSSLTRPSQLSPVRTRRLQLWLQRVCPQHPVCLLLHLTCSRHVWLRLDKARAFACSRPAALATWVDIVCNGRIRTARAYCDGHRLSCT